MGLLENINHPDDLKRLKREDLPVLAQEIREWLVTALSETGGHLASNLGAVELTLSLHYLFDTPQDQLVWDVGHQVYIHKLLTGRRKEFHGLRQFGGISGFARRSESPFDVFGAGHAATSISAALGIVDARDHRGEDYKVIAVIGDGALTAGMAFEGLNQAGAMGKDFIVILNDNEMSISKNVGAISAYLSRIITGKWYTRVKKETEDLLRTIPRIGEPMLKVAKKAEESFKGLIGPGILFEELGFQYAGPIDGHRFDHLLPTLENVKKMRGPVLIHVVTRKGHGYGPAEQDPIAYHGVSAFDPATGKSKKKASPLPTYTQVFSQALVELAKTDERIIAITAAMPEGTGLNAFAKAYPDRFHDVGIAEQHAVTFAAGLAVGGMRPVTAIYSTFLQRAYDQIIHDVCLQNLPVTFALDRAGLVGEDGPTHHGAFDLSYLRSIPNMVVMAPKDENELRKMLATAISYPGPAAIRYPRGNALGVPLDAEIQPVPIGQGEVVLEGRDVALVAVGRMVQPCLEVARILREEGIDVGVLNARFVKPLDETLLLEAVDRYKGLVTVEDGCLPGGFGSAVLEFLESHDLLDIPVRRLGLPDQFIEHGSQKELWRLCRLDAEGLAASVRDFVRKSVPMTSDARP